MSITAVPGFSVASTTAGIKPSGKPDMALVVNQGPEFNAAAVFTRNRVFASPVKISREAIADGQLKAVVFNSGNANACNGSQGDADARATVQDVAQQLGIDTKDVAACSTGLIGELLPMDKIHAGIAALVPQLSTTAEAGEEAAAAILTTDTVKKTATVTIDGSQGSFTVSGMGKGVGMMAPSLATMLVCIATDAHATPEELDAALQSAANVTFNTLDVDGSTSTNDTVIVMANGASGVSPTAAELSQAILKVCASLADQMQADAEGVTKRVRITVTGTTTDQMALNAARTLGRDNLFKCAMFGSDPNWGRVLAAVGMADADMVAEKISVSFNGEPVCTNCTGTPNARNVDLSGADIHVEVDLGTGGPGSAFVRTTDLSHQYVEINSAYSS